ncbi:hypothetical protein Naga_101745g1 [Nannochloropsis gaditana]|uniref:Uncharacterized protein n=1 Tax=Nannochloropsis gaditana TaxID=72520 RepID=W7TBW2_9STRA|nr:hypothetical protein Naga_101745g1 [Nannochloropsis gaditana]
MHGKRGNERGLRGKEGRAWEVEIVWTGRQGCVLPHREERTPPETLPHSAGGKRADCDWGGVTSEILLSRYSEMTVTPPQIRPMSLAGHWKSRTV